MMEETAGRAEKQDAVVRISDEPAPLRIEITSPVLDLFGRAIRQTAEEELARLSVKTGTVRIEDRQAMDFVIRARIRAAVQTLRGTGGSL